MIATILAAALAAESTVAENIFTDYWSKIATNPAPKTAFATDPSVSKSGNDAYRVAERGGALEFTGSNRRSLIYAVYDFFGRHGCRWFWDGDRLPAPGAVNVAKTDIREESRFEYRGMRYFAHRGLTRFQCEHWGLDDWKREFDWCAKCRLNTVMLRIGMDDTWQKAFPDIVPYPDPAKPLPEALKGYDNRSLFWSLEERGRLRRRLTEYALTLGLDVPTDFGTMTHWYSRTPKAYLEKVKPPFMPQASSDYSEPSGLVFDVRDPKWYEVYWQLTEAQLKSGYGDDRLLHTIGFGERRVFEDRERNFKIKCDVNDALVNLARRKRPDAKILLAGWDFFYSWSNDEVRRLIPRLDPKTTILWDYEADALEDRNFTNWGVVGKFPYVFGIFLCYEMGLDIRANYPLIERRFAVAKDDPMCKGVLLWPESVHTDTFAQRYFVENAWRPDSKSTNTRLAEFCRDRYASEAKAMESVWRETIPVSHTIGWYGNAGMFLTARLYSTNAIRAMSTNPAKMPEGAALQRLPELVARLHRIDRSDPMVNRDAVDLERTLADRALYSRQHRVIETFGAFRRGEVSASAVTNETRALVAGWRRFAELLESHEDYSLKSSLRRLKTIAPIANENFGSVLVENCANTYCRSHQAELSRQWYLPFAKFVAKSYEDAAARNVDINEQALADECERLRLALIANPGL